MRGDYVFYRPGPVHVGKVAEEEYRVAGAQERRRDHLLVVVGGAERVERVIRRGFPYRRAAGPEAVHVPVVLPEQDAAVIEQKGRALDRSRQHAPAPGIEGKAGQRRAGGADRMEYAGGACHGIGQVFAVSSNSAERIDPI